MLCLDIETIPLAASLTVPFDRATATPPSNYKSPEAIAKWLDSAEADYATARAKTCSLNPRLGRVLALAVGANDGITSLYAETDTDEPELLRQFWALVADNNTLSDGQLVTWNGAFDLRWLVVRSLAHQIEPSVAVGQWFKKYSYTPHCDVKAFLMQEWGARVAGEGLDEWAAFFGLDGKPEGVDGSRVYPMFLAGKHDEIRVYCESDVRSTLAMYRRIQKFI